MAEMITTLSCFALDGTPVSCRPVGNGLINKTFLAVTDTGHKYTVQTINSAVFKDIPALMENVVSVSRFLADRVDDERGTLHFIPTHDGKFYYEAADGSIIRVYSYIDDCLCLQAPECPDDFYESAVAFGRFQYLLRDFPAETLHETIPHFHDTPDRFRKLHAAAEADAAGRRASAAEELEFAFSRESLAGQLQAQLSSGKLPLRVTHNDTKLNNVMLDSATRKALCVIDLDTVMPGLAAYDFGDSIRFGAATAPEDEKDTAKMAMDLGLYRTYSEGFLSACPGLSEAELLSLPLGALTITLELAVRFLTDYLDGDRYFSIGYPEHNLVRARAQFALARDMEKKFEEMNRIIRECAGLAE